MKTKGKKCKTCKTSLHYEQLPGGMRVLTMVPGPEVELSPGVFGPKNGTLVYNTYCPTCKTHSTERKR